jgi:hypothetical protein
VAEAPSTTTSSIAAEPPEHGWLICTTCHPELTHGGNLVRFMRAPEFRAFQGAVLEHRRRERARAGDTPD